LSFILFCVYVILGAKIITEAKVFDGNLRDLKRKYS